jgi:hypothetical protein
MYLWKYWREAKNIFLGYLGLIAFAAVWITVRPPRSANGDNLGANPLVGVVLLFLSLVLLAVVAWYMGSLGIGRSLGEGAGSFLLTRPRSRSSFVWRDWGFGFLLLTVTVITTTLWSGYWLHQMIGASSDSVHGRVHFNNGPGMLIAIPKILGLNCLSLLLVCGLIFSVVYFSTVLVKNALGNMLGAATLIGYLILGAVLKHEYSIHLPSLLLNPYQVVHESMNTSFVVIRGDMNSIALADHFWLSVTIRAAILLLFPLGAQLVLNKSEI